MTYSPVPLHTGRGPVSCRWYDAPGSHSAVVWVGGIGGGWDSPARRLYPRLAERLQSHGIASLRVRFRNPRDLEEAVYDVSAGLACLEQQGVERIGFVGHSFGGAVVIEAATTTPLARVVITLATQSYGADRVDELPPACAVLLVHGTRDDVLAPANSEYIYRLAHEPKRLQLYRGAGHGLDEAAADLEALVEEWIITRLQTKSRRRAAS